MKSQGGWILSWLVNRQPLVTPHSSMLPQGLGLTAKQNTSSHWEHRLQVEGQESGQYGQWRLKVLLTNHGKRVSLKTHMSKLIEMWTDLFECLQPEKKKKKRYGSQFNYPLASSVPYLFSYFLTNYIDGFLENCQCNSYLFPHPTYLLIHHLPYLRRMIS